MKVALFTVAALLLAGCTTVEWPERIYVGESARDQIEVEVSSRISPSRKQATYTIINKSDRDVFCTSVTFRQITDHPDSYLEVGEDISVLHNVFIRQNQTLSDLLVPPGRTIHGPWHIRAVHAYQGFERCQQASLKDYCRSAWKTDSEHAFMDALLAQSGVQSCHGLNKVLSDGGVFDLRYVEDPQLRPLIYSTGTLQIILPESPATRAFAARLTLNSRSLYEPQFIFEPEYCREINQFEAALDSNCRMPTVN